MMAPSRKCLMSSSSHSKQLVAQKTSSWPLRRQVREACLHGAKAKGKLAQPCLLSLDSGNAQGARRSLAHGSLRPRCTADPERPPRGTAQSALKARPTPNAAAEAARSCCSGGLRSCQATDPPELCASKWQPQAKNSPKTWPTALPMVRRCFQTI